MMVTRGMSGKSTVDGKEYPIYEIGDGVGLSVSACRAEKTRAAG